MRPADDPQISPRKRSRRYTPGRTTIQGLTDVQQDIDGETPSQSVELRREQTWHGPAAEWSGAHHTGAEPAASTSQNTGLDFLATLASHDNNAAPSEKVADPPPPEREAKWLGGPGTSTGMPAQLENDHFGAPVVTPLPGSLNAISAASTSATTTCQCQPGASSSAATLPPSHGPGLNAPLPSSMVVGVGARGQLHRPCSNCRNAKVLCDRHLPCTRCVRLCIGETCEPPPTVQRGRPSHHSRLLQLRNLASLQQQQASGAVSEDEVAAAAAAASTYGPTEDGRASVASTSTSMSGAPVDVTDGAPTTATATTASGVDIATMERNVQLLRRQLLELGIRPCVDE